MKVYRRGNKIILHFGLGLIGSAFYQLLLQSDNKNLEEKSFPFDWYDSANKSIQMDSIETYLDKIADSTISELDIIWTAGRPDFRAAATETDKEYRVFIQTINWCIDIKNKFQYTTNLFFLSSAGGLFEGQVNISNKSIPSPSRPYGKLKLKQEKYIESHKSEFRFVKIIRPSSVFSLNLESGSRQGLIGTIINNIKSNKVTNIYGHPTTLRDYVLDIDVASCIYEDLDRKDNELVRTIIASGRPLSIFEILELIRRKMNATPLITYSNKKANYSNITYSRQGITPGKLSGEIEYLITRAVL